MYDFQLYFASLQTDHFMFGLFKKKLPQCDVLFKKYFSPWYEEGDRPTIARPDMFVIAAYEDEPMKMEEIQYMPDEYVQRMTEHITVTMVDAALTDFEPIIKRDRFDLAMLDAVDKYYDRARIAALIKESDPADFSNAYLVTVCEFGVMLGELFRQQGKFEWLYSYPYFHSMIVHTETGFGITVFDWAIKKFSEYGVDDGYVEKFKAAIAGVNGEWEEEEEEEG
jgi:hypothetical protein